MHTLYLYIPQEIRLSIPAEWNELDREELLYYCRPEKKERNYYEKAADMFLFILGNRARKGKKELPANWEWKLNKEEVANALACVDFLFRENELTDNLLPEITVDGTRYYGPESQFNDLTVGEYEETGIYAKQFKQTQDIQWLRRLAAVLYREKKNGKRVPYDAGTTETRPFNSIGEATLAAIYVWFVGCQNMLAHTQEFSLVFQPGGNGEVDMLSFTKTIHASAGPENGTRDQVRRTLLKELLLDIELKLEAAEEMKRKYENMKRK